MHNFPYFGELSALCAAIFWSIAVIIFTSASQVLSPFLITALKNIGREDILVIAGGVIPQQDYDYLFQSGVSGIFGPGSVIAESAIDILNKILRK